jgi:SAM-dependent methyltransferase
MPVTTTEETDSIAPLAVPDEPLALSAPIARELSTRLCHFDPRRGMSCAWYHGIWQYLRLFDLITTPRDHAAFYRAALVEPVRAGARRLLVSGTADYALPACLLWICGLAGAKPEITVLDICPTPLRLCEWYAERKGATIMTSAVNILDYDNPAPFDVVATHSFLGRFSPSERHALVSRWHRLLRPGGRVVMVNRIRPDAPDIVRFTPEQVERFVGRVRQAAESAGNPADISADLLVAMAQDYAAGHRMIPVRSTDEIVHLLEAGGFRIDQLTVSPVASRKTQGPSGPTMSGGAQYAQIVAVHC